MTSIHYYGQCYDFMKLIRFNKLILDIEFCNLPLVITLSLKWVNIISPFIYIYENQ